MAKGWRCLIRGHRWQLVETADRDKHSECVRCGKHDYTRHLRGAVGGRRMGNLPPGG